jgi:hypothetical protein
MDVDGCHQAIWNWRATLADMERSADGVAVDEKQIVIDARKGSTS